MDMEMDCKTSVYIVLVVLDVVALLIYKMSAPGTDMIDYIMGKRKSVDALAIVWTVLLLLFIIVPYFFVAAFCGGKKSDAGGASKRGSK